jgi:hypothetical protein
MDIQVVRRAMKLRRNTSYDTETSSVWLGGTFLHYRLWMGAKYGEW